MSDIRQFIESNAATIHTDSSKRTYVSRLRRLEEACGDLDEIEGPELVAFWTASTLAGSTLNSAKTAWRSYYRWAVRTGRVPSDPTVHLDDLRVPSKRTRPHNWLTAEQVGAVLTTCDATPAGTRDRALLSMGFFTGLRCSELCSMRWEAVDLGESRLRVMGKGEKPAVLGMNAQLRDALLEWAGHAAAVEGALFPAIRYRWSRLSETGANQRRFVTDQALTVSGVRDIVRAHGEQAGVPSLAPHDMRRTLAGIMDERGVPITDIQRVLRHSSVATTELYLRDNPARAVEVLQEFVL